LRKSGPDVLVSLY